MMYIFEWNISSIIFPNEIGWTDMLMTKPTPN